MNGDYQGLKRAHEEVESMNNSQFVNNNEPKKIKWDKSEAAQPSKVVHIRNLPSDVIIPEIITLGAPFGRVDKHFCLKDKGQALLQLNDVEAAQNMVKFYQQSPQYLRGKEIYVQFSHWQQIELNTPNGIDSSSTGKWEAGGNQTILWLVMQQPAYTVDLHVLHMIFTRFGKVLKIVTFTKNGQLQAFVQFSESKEAETALVTLEREGTFAKVEYSRFNQLEVKENNEKSWDFTVSPTLPVRVRPMGAAGYDPIGLIANGLGIQLAYQPTAAAALAAPLTTAAAAYAAAPFGLTYPAIAQIPQIKYPATAASLAAATAAMTGTVQTPVLLVSRLNEKMITPDALFTLFGVYGDVMRVKILYNNKGCALIQMRDPQQVALAITNLNNVVLYGNEIRVAPSHHHVVQMPAAGAADSGLTKDYSNSPLHRFKKPGSKNFNNIYPPSSTLHLSNIPQNTPEEDLLETFRKNDLKVVEFKFFPSDKRMALVQLESVEEAITALIKMHDYKLSETNHLRVSFSKAGIKNDRPQF